MIIKDIETLDEAKCFEIGRSCACANIRRAARVITQLYDGFLRPTSLRGTQFGLLMAVRALGPVTVTKLAERTMMDRTTLGRNLGLLEKKELIRIQPGKDQRVREVSLTDQGLEALMKALPLWEKAQTHVVKGLGEERMNNLLKDLSAMVSLVRKV